MLGLDNPLHIAFVLVLLLLVFGAKRLPELGKSLGSGLRGFKESISGDEPISHLTEAHSPVRVDEMTPMQTAERTAPVAVPAAPVAVPTAPVAVATTEPVAEPTSEPVSHAPMQPVA